MGPLEEQQMLTAEPSLQSSSDLLIAALTMGWVKKRAAKHIAAWCIEVLGKQSEVSSDIQELGTLRNDEGVYTSWACN